MEEAPVKRPRGRPRKVVTEPVVKRPRGRPRKVDISPENVERVNEQIDKDLALIGSADSPAKRGKTRAIKEDIQRAMLEVIEAKKQPRVKSLEEMEERFNLYFKRCAKQGIYPTIEELCAYSGYTYSTIRQWFSGIKKPPFGEATNDLVKNAKDYIAIFDAKMVIEGKLDFLTYCFRAKNFYGMTEKQELVISPNNPLGDSASQKELEEHYVQALYREIPEDEQK